MTDHNNDTAARQLMTTFLYPGNANLHNPTPTWLDFYHGDYTDNDLRLALDLTACAWLGRFDDDDNVHFRLQQADLELVQKWTEFSPHGLANMVYLHKITWCVLLETCGREYHGLRLRIWARRTKGTEEEDRWEQRLFRRMGKLRLDDDNDGETMDTSGNDKPVPTATAAGSSTTQTSNRSTHPEPQYRPPPPEPDFDPEHHYLYPTETMHVWLEYHARSVSVHENWLFVQGRERASTKAFRDYVEEWQRRRLAGTSRAGDLLRRIEPEPEPEPEPEEEAQEPEQEGEVVGEHMDEDDGTPQVASGATLPFRGRQTAAADDAMEEVQDEGAALGHVGMTLPLRGRTVDDAMPGEGEDGDGLEAGGQETEAARAQMMGGSFGSLGADGTGFGDV